MDVKGQTCPFEGGRAALPKTRREEDGMRSVDELTAAELPTLIPGVTINTGPESSMAYTQLQLQRWNGSTWDQFGKVLSAEEK